MPLLHKKLKIKIYELEKLGIVSQGNKLTDWINSLMVVKKPNSKLRITLILEILTKQLSMNIT